MQKLQVLSQKAYDHNRNQLANAGRIAQYRQDAACMFLDAVDRMDLEKPSVGAAPTLQMPSSGLPAASDAANAQVVYEYLGELSRVYAAEPRLWASLTHGDFWAYTRWRFPVPAKDEDAGDYIHTHWFVKGNSLASLRRNAVARLWWAAFLTVAPWEHDVSCEPFRHADRFHYTKMLLKSQQVYQDVMEREFGSNLRLRICFLDALEKHASSVTSLDRLVRDASVQLTLLLEFRHLLTLPVAEMRQVCDDIVSYSTRNIEAA